MPQTSRVILKAFQTVRLNLNYFFVHLLSLLVLGHFKIATGNLCKSPASLELLFRQLIKNFDTFLALVEAELKVRMTQYF
jgi:hypothetical protein